MIESGVSIARAVFAFNSVNVEGWALYAEAEMQPYEPLDGQLFALQMRAQRAARAFLDPMVNLGQITPEDVKQFLMGGVPLRGLRHVGDAALTCSACPGRRRPISTATSA